MTSAVEPVSSEAFLESALYLDSGEETLFALHTAPRTPRTDLGVVLAHSGANNFSAHRNGVWTTISRTLASEGIASLRFDFAGTGESSGLLVPGGQPASDASVAMDALRARGCGRLLVVGSCYGALPAVVASTARSDVVGGILLSPPLVLPGANRIASSREKFLEVANRSTLGAVVTDGDYRRWYFSRLISLAKTKAAMRFTRRSTMHKRTGSPQMTDTTTGAPSGMLLESELDRLAASASHLEIVYGTRDESLERVEGSPVASATLQRLRERPEGGLTWTLLEGSVHGLEDIAVQEQLIRLVVRRALELTS